MKVALLYIAIGEYTVFFDSFYRSCEKYFLPDTEKTYFVFSDKQEVCFQRENVVVKETINMGWPDNTLKRFHMFTSIENELQKYDYCFFFNANLEFVKAVTKEILPQRGIVVVQHPGYYNRLRKDFPYDTNEDSLAYISEGEGKVYVCGGVNGGRTVDYLKMCNELKSRVDRDYANDIVAKWHDESHLNRYILDIKEEEYVVWNPGFCYPDFFRMPFEEICHLKEKSYYITVASEKKKGMSVWGKIYKEVFTAQRFSSIRKIIFKKLYSKRVKEEQDLGFFVDRRKKNNLIK